MPLINFRSPLLSWVRLTAPVRRATTHHVRLTFSQKHNTVTEVLFKRLIRTPHCRACSVYLVSGA